jgi:hypothetical protein
MSTTSIPIFAADKQLSDGNWSAWEERIISSLRGRGLYGYPSGAILRPQNPTSLHPTLANSTIPSTEEWDLRDAMASAIIYQNVVDPRAHALSASETSRKMWLKLVTKFHRKSEVLKGQAMDALRSLKLASGRDLPAHLDVLTKLRSDALDAGARCPDEEYISIILASLPAAEFSNAMIILGDKKFAHEIIAHLRAHWDLVYKASVTTSGVAQALATHAGNSVGGGRGVGNCSNCRVGPHHRDNCWARGGGKEGYGPAWYKAPAGLEPRQPLIDAANVVKANRARTANPGHSAAPNAAFTAAVAAAAAAIAQAAAPAPAPAPAPTPFVPTAAAAFISPMPIYSCATYDDNEGVSGLPPSPVTVVDAFSRFRHFGSDSALLNERVICTVATPHVPCPSIFMAGVTHDTPGIPTFLDSAATDTCVRNRKRFTSYREEIIDGNTAVGGFRVVGTGRARFDVRVEGGPPRTILLDAIHTPDFTMNLISLPRLDRRGLVGVLGGGRLTVSSRDGSKIVDGVLTKTGGGRELYQVDIVDDLDDEEGVVVAIAGRNRDQPTDLETWHRRFGHSDVRVIERMAKNSLVDGLRIVGRDLRGLCEDCIFSKQDRMPYDDMVVHETEPLERVHLDLWGRARTPSWSGAVYMMLVSDGGTSMKFPLFLNNKTQETTLAAFREWVTAAELQTSKRLRRVRIDLGKEFNNGLFLSYCSAGGITVEKVPKVSSAANGHVERGNRTVVEGTRTQLIESGLDARF